MDPAGSCGCRAGNIPQTSQARVCTQTTALARILRGLIPWLPDPSSPCLGIWQWAPALMVHIPFQKELCFDDELVLQQLRYTGMLETVRIRRSGYSAKYTFQVGRTYNRNLDSYFTAELLPSTIGI